jgi:predicted nucleotidyltransferase
MDINELESFNMADAVAFHKELNPRLWEDEKLDPEVRDQLLLIAEDFVEYLGISNLKVKDVTISGSNAAYSYTPHSDLDLHVLVDFNELPNNEVYQELFTAKKTLYNDAHDITVRDVPVELYVQDTNNPVQSLGEYSIVHDKWIRIPKKRRANFDQAATKLKYEKLGELIELALKTKDPKRVNDTIALVKRYRKSGLDKAGEFGPENLAYKAVRKQGLVQALHDLKAQLHTEKLSIDEYANEDYDPNGPPPGPEFKPTMPAGTVKVDVSDVYDWYKLGQHISNMKGLGKHDFGQGPPSTILSFGDEDTEHKYIQDLEKTGLTTTDIDPVDPNQPKGMKRQKTDPTFNVNETDDRKAAVLKIQKHLNKKYGANLDLDGKLGPLTLKSINKFMPRAKTGLS